MTRRMWIPFASVLIAAIVSVQRAPAQNIIMGVLEENRGHYAGDSNYRDVRVVFEKNGNGWQPFPSNCPDRNCLKTVTSSYPPEVAWTIAFDGRNLGRVVSRTPNDFRWYSDVGQQEITSANPPTIGARSVEFGGYTDAVVHRPLLANSEPYFSDPERWNPTALSAELTAALQQAFRMKFPKLCRLSETDHSTMQPFSYRNDEVRTAKAYASRLGWLVARLHLEAVDCEDVEAGFDIDDPWFVIDTQKSIAYLDSGMWLVDAGDYDNDGKSELIFSINRDNEGGYEIWYDNFKRHATFKFNYH